MKTGGRAKQAMCFTLMLLFIALASTSSADAARGHRELGEAPAITSTGKTLSWSPVFAATSYEILRNIPGHRSQIFYVSNRTKVVAYGYSCSTLGYKVRAAIWGEWSNEAHIRYGCSRHRHHARKQQTPHNEEEQIRKEAELLEHPKHRKHAKKKPKPQKEEKKSTQPPIVKGSPEEPGEEGEESFIARGKVTQWSPSSSSASRSG